MYLNNEILFRLHKALNLTSKEMVNIYKLEAYEITEARLDNLLKRRQEEDFVLCGYEELGIFLDALIIYKRGASTQTIKRSETVELSNNLILKKLRIALELKEPETEIIFSLGEASLSKQEFKALFRKEENKNFKACSNTLLFAFLEGLGEFNYEGAEV